MDYAAPEVRSGAAFSAASDVYALGLLLYRLLTGRRPFPASGGDPTPPRKVCPACPTGLAGLLLGMLSPRPEGRPALAAVLRTLDDEQAELAAELDNPTDRRADCGSADRRGAPEEQAIDRPPAVAADGVAVEPNAEPTADADTVAAESTAAFISTNDGAVPATPGGLHSAPADPGTTTALLSSGLPRHAVGLLVLGVTAAVSLAIGRATVSRDPTAVASALTSRLADEQTASPIADERSALPPRSSPPASAPPGEAVPPAANKPPPLAVTEEKKEVQPRPVRREAVSADEAMTAAQGAMPRLRGCKEVPRFVTVALKIVRGRGVITSLNEHDLAPNDPRYPWHACVKQALERVRFPLSATIGRVQIRLALR